MAIYKPKIDEKPQSIRKVKIETTYEYVPLVGELLGWWRKVKEDRMGDEICIYLNHSLESYDRLFINGQEIDTKEIKDLLK